MGSSGSGKTTVLNMISDRIKKRLRGNRVEGKVLVNDTHPLDHKMFAKIGAYVMQDDHLFEFFTPKEALRFAARLKL